MFYAETGLQRTRMHIGLCRFVFQFRVFSRSGLHFFNVVMATAEFRTFVKYDLPHVSCVLIPPAGPSLGSRVWDRCCPKTAGERIAEAMVSNAFEDLCVKKFGVLPKFVAPENADEPAWAREENACLPEEGMGVFFVMLEEDKKDDVEEDLQVSHHQLRTSAFLQMHVHRQPRVVESDDVAGMTRFAVLRWMLGILRRVFVHCFMICVSETHNESDNHIQHTYRRQRLRHNCNLEHHEFCGSQDIIL